jgi:hypothetical protein
MPIKINHTTLPLLADVILKVKLRQPLTLEEELVYLIFIEELPEEKAIKLIEAWFDDSGFHFTS